MYPHHVIYEVVHLQLILHVHIGLLLTQELAQNIATGDEVVDLLRCRTALGDDLLHTSEFLVGILLVLAELLGNLNIVLGVLVLQALGSLLHLTEELLNVLGGGVLGDQLVEGGNGASSVIETASDGAVSASLLVHELNEGLLGASARVGNTLLGALGEEFDGRVSGDTLLPGSGFGVLSFSINLGDHNVGLEDEVLSEGLPGRGEVLAVWWPISTP